MNLMNKNIKAKISYLLLYSYFALLIIGAFHYHNINVFTNSVFNNQAHQATGQNIDNCIVCHFNSATYDVPTVIFVNIEYVFQFHLINKPENLINSYKSVITLRGPPLSFHS